MTEKMRELRDIPNSVGFRLQGVTKDRRKVDCVVVQRADGTHTVSGCEYSELAGWWPVNQSDERQALASRKVPKRLKDA